MKTREDVVRKYNSAIIQCLEEEEKSIGGYRKRYEELSGFRRSFSVYVKGDPTLEEDLNPTITVLDNGSIIDHHALGYYAPMEFERRGVGGGYRSPISQLRSFRDQLRSHGIRMIYIPLPCKVAVDPTVAVDESFVPQDGMIIPQWRNMIKSLSLEGFEIIDCYDRFRNTNRVFSKNHHISPIGAEIVADECTKYVESTTEIQEERPKTVISRRDVIGSPILYHSGNNNSVEMGMEYYDVSRYMIEGHPITGSDTKSKIAIIGDCNLQCYRGIGCDVTAQISGMLKYHVSYLGRYLPFANVDSINKLPENSLKGVEILLYVGFVSACFVRAYRNDISWCAELIKEEAFG